MTRASSKQVSMSLAEFKDAVQRLSKLYTRTRALIAVRMQFRSSDGQPNQQLMEESVENKIQRFSRALTDFVKLRRKTRETLAVFEKSLTDLESAESIDEISTLIGLTLLTDQREYNQAMNDIIKCYENELYPVMPEITGIVKFAGQLNEGGKWASKLFNYDPITREDDFTRMILAIRDHDIDRFNEVHDKLIRRLGIEERR